MIAERVPLDNMAAADRTGVQLRGDEWGHRGPLGGDAFAPARRPTAGGPISTRQAPPDPTGPHPQARVCRVAVGHRRARYTPYRFPLDLMKSYLGNGGL